MFSPTYLKLNELKMMTLIENGIDQMLPTIIKIRYTIW